MCKFRYLVMFIAFLILISCSSATFEVKKVKEPVLIGNRINKNKVIDVQKETSKIISGSVFESQQKYTKSGFMTNTMVTETTTLNDVDGTCNYYLNNESEKSFIGQLYFIVTDITSFGSQMSQIQYIGKIYKIEGAKK